MRLLGVTGPSGSGKTTLITRLLPRLRARGLTVSTIKHTHHDVDLDRPGKDSHRHRLAGAAEVLVASSRRWALLHEHGGAPAPPLADLAARLAPVDLVLVEGFGREPFEKIEVYREAGGRPPLFASDPTIVAVAADATLPPAPPDSAPLPRFDIDDAEAIAAFVAAHCRDA